MRPAHTIPTSVFDALDAANRSFFTRPMLSLALWPLLGSILLWGLVGALYWSELVNALTHWIAGRSGQDLGAGLAHGISGILITVVMIIIGWQLVQITALFITAFIAMPYAVKFVARQYPQLELRRGGDVWGSTWNALAATLIFLLLWVLTLPLWLLGFTAVLLPVLLSAYLNDRVFRYDALADHASRAEYKQLSRARRGGWFALGIAAALLQLVPFVNLLSPVYSGLSFVHFGLAELARLRASQTAR
jgi:energy-converting hydrogenase Eha subunit A